MYLIIISSHYSIIKLSLNQSKKKIGHKSQAVIWLKLNGKIFIIYYSLGGYNSNKTSLGDHEPNFNKRVQFRVGAIPC